ncbi:hypothetical protein Aperf_G00000062443 [Anoplocephala perfoliata]
MAKSGKTKTGSAAPKLAANAPKATMEQINLAKLLTTGSDDVATEQFKLQQIQECTACTLDIAVSALHDADNDVHRAIEILLDTKYEDDWRDMVPKRTKSKRQNEQKSKNDKIKEKPKFGSNQSLNDKKTNIPDAPKKQVKANGNKKNAKQSKTDPDKTPRKPSNSEIPPTEAWALECGEWKGEAIEIVNSCVDIPLNIHEDTELLKLVTSESIEPPVESVKEEAVEVVENKPEEPTKEEVEKPEELAAEPTDQIKLIKAQLFSTFARSATPPSSDTPVVPIYFAPGSTVCSLRDDISSVEFGTNYLHPPLPQFNQYIYAKSDQPVELNKSQIASVQKLANSDRVDSQERLTNPNHPGFSSVVPPLIPQVTPVAPMLQPDQAFSAPLQNVSVQKESYTKIQEQAASQGHPQTVNNFDKPYNYNILGELSQNMKNVSLDMQAGKTDAFTQSVSSAQPDNMAAAPYQLQSSKPPGVQQSQINKPISVIPPSTGQQQQSMPTTQAPLHTFMHLPQLMSQLQHNVPFFNFPQGSPATAPPPIFDIDQFHALQQQRVLYEMQGHAPPQTVASDGNMPTAGSADVIASTKPANMPIHQVTPANVNSGFAFMPYTSGMVLMNGYPNTYLGQQQSSQAAVPQSQSPGHGGSPLSHASNNQFPKTINSAPSYTGYPNLRQSNFEEVGEAFYQNLSKQMNYKHAPGVQGYYNAPKPDMSLGNNRQQAVGMPSTQQQQQQVSNQPPNLYSQQGQGQYSYYQTHALAVAAAVAAQNQQPSQAAQSAAAQGPSGIMPMHARSTH